jgi:G3E family GTPase
VTVLSGFSASTVRAAARRLLSTDDRLIAVMHDLTGVRDGSVRRVVRTATTVIEDATVQLVHGCVSCTLREDVLPTLARMASTRPGSDLLLVLPPAVEPEAVAAASAHAHAPSTMDDLRFDSYVTVVDADSFLDDLASTDDLRDRDLHAAEDDERAVAEVVGRQVEFCDTIVLWRSPGTDALELQRLSTLLHRLAPWAVQVPAAGDTDSGAFDRADSVGASDFANLLRRSGRHDPTTPGMIGRALEGRPIGLDDPDAAHGVASILFEVRRPFHPSRLDEALEELTSEALRGRGQLWLASQPDTVVGFESGGGGVGLSGLGHWLAALPTARWTEMSDLRRLNADLTWDPYYGDRRTVLAFIGLNLDAYAINSLLNDCLLTDAELAEGFDAWRELPDPFAGCFPLPETDAA